MARDRILVLGLMGQYPMAGIGWQSLHYLIGLERLGFDVYYVEDSGAPPYDPSSVSLATAAAQNVAFVRAVMARTAFPENWVYWDSLENVHHGPSAPRLRELYETSDQIWNLSGATLLRPEHNHAGVRVYVQTDPGLEQIALAAGDRAAADRIDAHDVLFTYGENVPVGRSTLPPTRRVWHATRPPVLLEQWEASPPAADAPFSTIGSWRNEGNDATWHGRRRRWSKEEAFGAFLEAPRDARVRMQAALRPPAAAVPRLREAGWTLRDPHEVSGDLDTYRHFVHGSCGEFTVAKDVYVESRSGWFSDRSATYLASGRPVVTQDTAFGETLRTGTGLLAYRTREGAAEALRSVAADVGRHARAARQIAEEYFDASRVLRAMLETIDQYTTRARRRRCASRP